MSIDKVIALYEGMHFEGECRALNRQADSVHEGVIVSIGSFRGQADCALALHAHVPVFCIDPRQGWTGEPHEFGDQDRPFWMQNVLDIGVASKVRPIELPSLVVAKIWDKPIGMLFVDGNHDEVAADLEAWLPHVLDGGLVALHDNNASTVIAAVTSRDDLVEIERSDLTTFYRKEPLYEPFTYDGLAFYVRKGPYSKDDRYVLGEVRSYDIGTEPIKNCIDVGGQIGGFTLWIATKYPHSEIVAVEPEMSCYRLLNLNVPADDRVVVLNRRVNYDTEDKLLFVDPVNAGSHRIMDQEDVYPGQSVVPAPEAITLEQIMKDRGWETLSLLKIDAEGAERDILLNCSEGFLRSVRRIVGEFHTNFGSPMEPIAARLESLGFAVTAETNPAAHATFCAINQNWQERERGLSIHDDLLEKARELGERYTVVNPDDSLSLMPHEFEPPIEYGTVIEERKATPKKTPPKKKGKR